VKVYIAVHGEQCEGYSIISVHTKKEDAIVAAKKSRAAIKGGWQADDENVWVNGCDFIKVEEFEVET
jgi:hypothetical protein